MNWEFSENRFDNVEMVSQSMVKKSTNAHSQEKKKDNNMPLKQKERLIWGSACLFLGFWMFCVGVLVGRGSAPVKFDTKALQKELTARKEAAEEKNRLRYHSDSKKADVKTELKFYEELKHSQDVPQTPGKRNGTPPRNTEKDDRPATESKNRSVPMKTRSETFKKPASLTKKSMLIPGNWTIQVAALKNASDADRMVSRLIKGGYAAYKLTETTAGQTRWHRIRVGRFERQKEAQAETNKLKKDGYSTLLIQFPSLHKESP